MRKSQKILGGRSGQRDEVERPEERCGDMCMDNNCNDWESIDGIEQL